MNESEIIKDISSKNRQKILFPLLTFVFFLSVIIVVYGISVVSRSQYFYETERSGGTGTSGKLFDIKPEVGYLPLPHSRALMNIPQRNPVATYQNDDGVRSSTDVGRSFDEERHPRILFLGDSFTYGFRVEVESTFPNRVRDELGGESINAGVPGYNFPQMIMRAKELIPKYKPDYVVVQYSPWLVWRSVAEFSPTEEPWLLPAPYFTGKDKLEIAKPAFSPCRESLLLDKYKGKINDNGIIHFFWKIALPCFAYQDSHLILFNVRKAIGISQRPTENLDEIVRKTYSDINHIAISNSARMIVLFLGNDNGLYLPVDFFPKGVEIINGHDALWDALEEKTQESYHQHYWILAGDPPVPTDWHPNEWAHEVISQSVSKKINALEKKKG